MFSPTTICGVLVNWSLLDRPEASSPSVPSAIAASTSTVPAHTSRGRPETALPTRLQTLSFCSARTPYTGLAGQKIHRPQATSRAGISVVMASRPTRTPMAQAGPMPLVELRAARVSSIRLTATVAALATMAGPARYRASAIASCRSSWRASSSR